MAQFVRASDRHSEDPGLNPGWISMSFFTTMYNVLTRECEMTPDPKHAGSNEAIHCPIHTAYRHKKKQQRKFCYEYIQCGKTSHLLV